MNGKIYKTAEGFNSYEISEADEKYIFTLADILIKQLGFTTDTTPISGLDGVYWDFLKEDVKLTVGWDIWSGAFVMAYCLSGNKHIETIACCNIAQ